MPLFAMRISKRSPWTCAKPSAACAGVKPIEWAAHIGNAVNASIMIHTRYPVVIALAPNASIAPQLTIPQGQSCRFSIGLPVSNI